MTIRSRMRAIGAGLLATFVACTPKATDRVENGWTPARIDTLLHLGAEDQDNRENLIKAVAAQDTAVLFAFMRSDSARTRWLRNAVEAHGWPSREKAGDSAQKAAWLIVQHSPDTAWQAAQLPTLETLAERGELPAGDVAMLTDRILVQRGQPQRYGSQFSLEENKLVPAPVENIGELDARRASVGLPPMIEYVKLMETYNKVPVVWPPQPRPGK